MGYPGILRESTALESGEKQLSKYSPSPASRAQREEVSVRCCEILRCQKAVKNKFLKIKSESFLISISPFSAPVCEEEHRYQF